VNLGKLDLQIVKLIKELEDLQWKFLLYVQYE
jgi:hypothetical protein